MARIFISHSSADNAAAVALRDWLVREGWDDLFLDLDAERGITAGERWERALHDAANRCEAVLFLVSTAWLASRWCLKEFHLAAKLNKRMFGVVIEELKSAEIPPEVKATWQLVNLASGTDHEIFRAIVPPRDTESHVTFSRGGLTRLKNGLAKAGLDPRFFAWPPEDDPERPPYRGLRPLEASDAGIFFGREAAKIEVLDRLRGLRDAAPPRVLVILGASGAGKSSFLRAGLLPRLARDDRNFLVLPPVRPERAALSGDTGLVRSLETALKDADIATSRAAVSALVNGGAEAAITLFVQLAAAARVPAQPGEPESRAPTIVLSVDQGEELFLADGKAEAETFLTLLKAIVEAATPETLVMFTIRSDSYEALQTAKTLEGVRQETFSLPPLPRGAYQTVIEGPAERLATTRRPLRIEPALTEALLADIEAGGSRDALPLLAFTLERLYLEHGGDGDLLLSEYRAIGGVRGSIEAAVERALAAADADPKVPRDPTARLALLRRAFIPWLAGVDPQTGVPRRRVARLSEIPEDCRPLLSHLVDARVLATDVNRETGERTVEPAHETLLRQWSLLTTWLTEDSAALATLEGVRRGARDWLANGKSEGWLAHDAGRLEDAERLRQRADFARYLEPDDWAYLEACRLVSDRERDRELQEARQLAEEQRKSAEAQKLVNRRTRMGLAAAAILAVLAIGGAWLAFVSRGEAEAQATRAKNSEVAAMTAARQAQASEVAATAERDRAQAQTREVEKRSALLSTNVAKALAAEGVIEPALLLMLQASKAFDEASAPDEVHIAFNRVLDRAARSKSYAVPPGLTAVETGGTVLFIDPKIHDVLRFEGAPPLKRVVQGQPGDAKIVSLAKTGDGRSLILVRADHSIERAELASGKRTVLARFTGPKLAEDFRGHAAQTVTITHDGLVIDQWDLASDGPERDVLLQILDIESGAVYSSKLRNARPLSYASAPGIGRTLFATDVEHFHVLGTGRQGITLTRRPMTKDALAELHYRHCLAGRQDPADAFRKHVLENYTTDPTARGECRIFGQQLILSSFISHSAGGSREDTLVEESEANDIRQRLRSVAPEFSSRADLTWIGIEPKSGMIGAILQRHVVVVRDHKAIVRQRHPYAPELGWFIGEETFAVFESGNGRIVLYDLAAPDLRQALLAPAGHGASAGAGTLTTLRRSTCEIDGLARFSEGDLPDGRRITVTPLRRKDELAGYRLAVGSGTAARNLVLNGSSCFEISQDGTRLMTAADGGGVKIFDLAKALSQGSGDQTLSPMLVLPEASSSSFVGPQNDVIAAVNGLVKRWSHRDGAWTSQEVYRGDNPIFEVESDRDGARLLLTENVGIATLRAFYWSTAARDELLDLATEYKWLTVAFTAKSDIAVRVRSEPWAVVRPPPLNALITEAEQALSSACRPTTANDYRTSPCWPASLAR
jgi:hypothetical protein